MSAGKDVKLLFERERKISSLARIYHRKLETLLIYINIPSKKKGTISFDDFFNINEICSYINTIHSVESEEVGKRYGSDKNNRRTKKKDDSRGESANTYGSDYNVQNNKDGINSTDEEILSDKNTNNTNNDENDVIIIKTDTDIFIKNLLIFLNNLIVLYFSRSNLVDVCINRRSYNKCGFYACDNIFLNNLNKSKYKIDIKNKNIYLREYYDLFCSTKCMNFNLYLLKQIIHNSRNSTESINLKKKCQLIHIMFLTFFPFFKFHDITYLFNNIDNLKIVNNKIYIQDYGKQLNINEKRGNEQQPVHQNLGQNEKKGNTSNQHNDHTHLNMLTNPDSVYIEIVEKQNDDIANVKGNSTVVVNGHIERGAHQGKEQITSAAGASNGTGKRIESEAALEAASEVEDLEGDLATNIGVNVPKMNEIIVEPPLSRNNSNSKTCNEKKVRKSKNVSFNEDIKLFKYHKDERVNEYTIGRTCLGKDAKEENVMIKLGGKLKNCKYLEFEENSNILTQTFFKFNENMCNKLIEEVDRNLFKSTKVNETDRKWNNKELPKKFSKLLLPSKNEKAVNSNKHDSNNSTCTVNKKENQEINENINEGLNNKIDDVIISKNDSDNMNEKICNEEKTDGDEEAFIKISKTDEREKKKNENITDDEMNTICEQVRNGTYVNKKYSFDNILQQTKLDESKIIGFNYGKEDFIKIASQKMNEINLKHDKEKKEKKIILLNTLNENKISVSNNLHTRSENCKDTYQDGSANEELMIEEKTNDEKTNDEKTNDEKTNDEKTNDEKTNDEKTNDAKTNDEKTNDEKTNDAKTNDEKTNDEKLQTNGNKCSYFNENKRDYDEVVTGICEAGVNNTEMRSNNDKGEQKMSIDNEDEEEQKMSSDIDEEEQKMSIDNEDEEQIQLQNLLMEKKKKIREEYIEKFKTNFPSLFGGLYIDQKKSGKCANKVDDGKLCTDEIRDDELRDDAKFGEDTKGPQKCNNKYVYSTSTGSAYEDMSLYIVLWDIFTSNISKYTVHFFQKSELIIPKSLNEVERARKNEFLYNISQYMPIYINSISSIILNICRTFLFHKPLFPFKKIIYKSIICVIASAIIKHKAELIPACELKNIKKAEDYLKFENNIDEEELNELSVLFFQNNFY
ncbi:conserved Plasmodium protein, unknown function [Plasmodium malariae]|uniref:RTR1-type domain-containing protein n=1 Tax=Plasmodium malariae TaxID=5858 RepID=A0A1D3JJ51_PLAMA|nr:conserved Plasmodium protein, unknown function [Plasmodium malariae]SBT86489.1 conserved Plasmodium protein, unknown function [Plasmodium malariae]